MQLESVGGSTSSGSMLALNELPPMIWCRCADGVLPGSTSGSMRSNVSCEQPKRISSCAAAVAASETAARDLINISAAAVAVFDFVFFSEIPRIIDDGYVFKKEA